ncbi:nitric oxide synthase, salivary gland-like [Phymastichus coffea]|uniref:nitric oxide synthase, salivary gland-like n=1 Tax=Phymastichus coffea TaxID=108790 RepID=UPI00273CE4FD|nr:nitric oxide synthase, salivary gland-like [Phymastichus coffea]
MYLLLQYMLSRYVHTWRVPHTGGTTLLLELQNFFPSDIEYEPGDHLGVFPCNKTFLVDGILAKLDSNFDSDMIIELQLQKQVHTPNGVVKTWIAHDKYQGHSLRTLLTRFIDITTPPSPNLLKYFASIASDSQERERLNILASDSVVYEDWRYWNHPNLLETLIEYPSVRPYAPVLLVHLTLLQPRFYSISSSPLSSHNQIDLTVAVVQYKTKGETGPLHYGVCSNYLKDVSQKELIYIFFRSAPNFHMPEDKSLPIILVGPGTGIAPFRAFWNHRKAEKNSLKEISFGKIWLFFGCRLKMLDLYRDEKDHMIISNILNREFLALSREPGISKAYVQDLIQVEAKNIYKMLVHEKGHFYVCGDCTMAEDVYQTLKQIIKTHGNMTEHKVENYMLSLRDENRFHEDIFGITLRTAEVHNRSRETARIKLISKPSNDTNLEMNVSKD